MKLSITSDENSLNIQSTNNSKSSSFRSVAFNFELIELFGVDPELGERAVTVDGDLGDGDDGDDPEIDSDGSWIVNVNAPNV